MEFKGSLAYDEQDFLQSYLKRRSRPDSPNNAIEGPMINDLLGEMDSAHILDLGCGDGRYGQELLAKGVKRYTGVEGSAAMFSLASKALAEPGAAIIHSAMEDFDYPRDTYDTVISRMALHYIENLDEIFRLVHKSMKTDAKFIFSVQHPLTTAAFKSKNEGERKGDWLVDDYFNQGVRKEPWIGKTVVKYHRTIEHYFTALTAAGFHIEALKEGEPVKANFAEEEEFERRKRIPIILVFSCTKTADQK
ncbi:class I SAM-dependent DNA methyltransferase [Planococcus halotolerans]|uniref:SAM-dependent methyltransferase n=1 Tax=Planococcus halotolerans TaxID=2233542 RepID=A0A365L1A0_9BACL|nr:class I SAM-dependent methyltransferase [Planococcus halotolerans]QHJ71077.1 methyltransferase domain-containing protein [Planococcus halotolerans]RAZ79162.1 SAM-dependent methyltransferase [Planococcus halotolerans]